MERIDKLISDVLYLAEVLNAYKRIIGSGKCPIKRLDKLIADISYLGDALRSHREIVESGCCNDCVIKKYCQVAPKPGQLVRYNCPLYQKEEE